MPDTVLLLRSAETRGLVTMAEVVRLMEEAYRDLGENRAQVLNREWLRAPVDRHDTPLQFLLNIIPGAVPCHDAVAMRLSARHASFPPPGGAPRATTTGGFSGFVLVWELSTRRLLGIVQDDAVSPLRVGATSALAARFLCRADAAVAGMIGAGRQAVGQVTGLLTVRPGIRELKVYSPTPQRRERFAAWVNESFGVKARAVDSAETCVRGSDVVFTATNAVDPVVRGAWLEEGVHVCGMIGTPHYDTRRELDDDVGRRADIVVVNSIAQARHDAQAELLNPIRKGYLSWDRVSELAELCTGRAAGRVGARQITWHSNNTGMGIQFASICRRMIEIARSRGVGTELPGDYFAAQGSAAGDQFRL
ncbi:MAG: ornithine cyclodeaminase family protein [Burkholderiales bacterium]|nr:ornithine cyclodeaminase family protein [Burkholderiales bacterium]